MQKVYKFPQTFEITLILTIDKICLPWARKNKLEGLDRNPFATGH